MNKILITGYTGFVGSNFVNLFSKKYSLIGVNRKHNKIQSIKQIKKDIRKITLNDIPKDIDFIIHLAATSEIKYCENNPRECFEININGTEKMLEIARKLDTKLLFMSTSHVYGNPKKPPISENHPLQPTSIYSTSKLASEIICESYANSYDLEISIIRLFSTYGPYEPSYKVTSEIISQILTKNTITLGNLHPKRDFIYIEDVVRAIDIVINKSKKFNIFNVGSGKSHSISAICKKLQKITKKNIPIKSSKVRIRKQEIDNVVADCSKIKKLGWTPKVDLNKGLQLTLNWFINKHNIRKY